MCSSCSNREGELQPAFSHTAVGHGGDGHHPPPSGRLCLCLFPVPSPPQDTGSNPSNPILCCAADDSGTPLSRQHPRTRSQRHHYVDVRVLATVEHDRLSRLTNVIVVTLGSLQPKQSKRGVVYSEIKVFFPNSGRRAPSPIPNTPHDGYSEPTPSSKSVPLPAHRPARNCRHPDLSDPHTVWC